MSGLLRRRMIGWIGSVGLFLASVMAAPQMASAVSPYQLTHEWGGLGTGDSEFDQPQGIAVDEDDNLYVVDSSNHRIQKFDTDGTFLLSFGSQGTGDGELESPFAVDVNGWGDVYVTEKETCKITRFDASGGVLNTYKACIDPGGKISDLTVGLNFEVFAIEVNGGGGYRVHFLDPDLTRLTQWKVGTASHDLATVNSALTFFAAGGPECIHQFPRDNIGSDPAECWIGRPTQEIEDDPSAISNSYEDSFFLVDSRTMNVFQLSDRGILVLMFDAGKSGTDYSGVRPSGIAADSGGGVYVSDPINNTIRKYEFEDADRVSVWPRQSILFEGQLGKLGGVIQVESGGPLEGVAVNIQSREKASILPSTITKAAQPGPWETLALVYSDESGYFQQWFRPEKSREYRAFYDVTNTKTSNVFSFNLIPSVTIWNPGRSLTYSGWTRVHGLLGDSRGGPVPATQVFLQVWDYAKKKWVWKSTFRTTPTGYYDFWFKPYGTTHYRVATWGSASASNQVTKTVHKKVLLNPGATVLKLGSSTRIQAEVQPRHPGSVGYFQEWDFTTKKWKWIKTLSMDSSSKASYSWKLKSKGWHAIRVYAPRHWDHEENYSAIHWIEVR